MKCPKCGKKCYLTTMNFDGEIKKVYCCSYCFLEWDFSEDNNNFQKEKGEENATS